jgi:hypothetical protein
MNLHKEAKLNHLSFPTTDVVETAAFFEKCKRAVIPS